MCKALGYSLNNDDVDPSVDDDSSVVDSYAVPPIENRLDFVVLYRLWPPDTREKQLVVRKEMPKPAA